MSITVEPVEVTLGSVARFTVTVKDADGDLATPADIRLQLEVGDTVVIAEGTVTLSGGEFTLVSLGIYQHLHDVDVTGLYEWRIETDTPQGAEEGWFIVPASRMTTP